MKKTAIILACMALGCAAAFAQPKLSQDNIPEIVSALSTEQKACLVVGFNSGCEGYDPGIPGTGGITYPIPQFGIPSIVMMDGPVGVRLESDWKDGKGPVHFMTSFPTGLLTAASWDRTVAYKLGQGIAEECLSVGADVILGPGMNLLRNPLCGRNFEYFSEDPLLSGSIAAAYVNGVQDKGVGTSVKHFAANNQEVNRLDADSRLDTRALRELYVRGFEICLRESSPWTLMASYNMLNGTYTQESHELLTDILRGDFGYEGLVVTDWTGKRNTPAQVHAGCDLFMGGMKVQTEHILQSIENGSLAIEDLDRAVTKVLELIVKTPAFRGNNPDYQPDLVSHAKLAREIACEGMVLMKNNETLPLQPCRAALFGVHSYDLIPGGNGAAFIECPPVIQVYDGLKDAGFSLDDGLKRLYDGYAAFAAADVALNHKIPVHVGKAQKSELEITFDLIKSVEKTSDVAVITLGRVSGEARDRSLSKEFFFSKEEVDLVKNVCDVFHAAGKKVAVVLNICGAVDTESWSNYPDAILCAWLPGEEGGHSIADVLTGKVNPSGRLPMSFPLDYFDFAGAFDFPYEFKGTRANESAAHPERRGMDPKNISFTDYVESVFVGYRDLFTAGKSAAYPFGFGLSYTRFIYSDIEISQSGENVELDVTVTNVGQVAGKDALGIYVQAPLGSFERKPLCELRAFGKTALLEPGQGEKMHFTIPLRDLASFNSELSRWEVAEGKYVFRFGADNSNPFVTKTFKLSTPRIYPVRRACEPKNK